MENIVAEIEKRIGMLVAKNGALDRNEAVAQVFQADPDLYARYRNDVPRIGARPAPSLAKRSTVIPIRKSLLHAVRKNIAELGSEGSMSFQKACHELDTILQRYDDLPPAA